MSTAKELIKTAKISSKGRLVIPQDVRESLNIESSDELILVTQGDKIIMRKLHLGDILREAELEEKQGKTIPIEKVEKKHA